jgi:4-hydroxythreonine-4-phosphate dehydrogenase
MNANNEPVVAVTIGDPCGIGPEVVVKALGEPGVPGRKLLIGDARVVEQTLAMVRSPLRSRAVDSFEQARFEPGCIDVLDPGTLKSQDVTPGVLSTACGRATLLWWELASKLAEHGKVAAIVKGPINSEAQRAAAGPEPKGTEPVQTHLFLITGPLRVVHLTDHVTLREMLDRVKMQSVLDLIRLMHDSLKRWGIAKPRIGVAGLNPHCYGPEDKQEIAPAVAKAASEGIEATGPVPPDSIFRQCIEGQFDCVVAHYHDQGHIPVKTWKFSGNCALVLGEPYLRMSVAHGTAFDIAGKGVADHLSMTAAIKTVAMLAAGRGFPDS